jgi:hypothetical protein
MPTKTIKNNKTIKKTLKNRINNYILKKGDICCEKYINKNKVIELIFNNYMVTYKIRDGNKDEYLDGIDNDLVKFIGFKVDLENKNDKEGLEISDIINKKILKNKKPNKEHITKLLMSLPLYYLLAFLGYSSYEKYNEKEHNQKLVNIRDNKKNKLFGIFNS